MPMPVLGESVRLRETNLRPFPLLPVWFLVVIFYLNITSRIVFSPLLPVIEGELGLRHGEAGSLFLLIQIGYCLGLLGSGFVASWLNHRRTILVSTTTLGAVLLVMSRSASVTGLRAELVLLGAFAGLYLPSGIATLTGEIRKEHWGKALAIHELAPNLGFVTAPLLAEALLRFLPWRGVLAVLGSLAILMGGIFALAGHGGSRRAEPPRFDTMKQIARDPSFWVIATLFAVSIGSGLGVYTMMPLFLVTEIGLERELANTIAGLSRGPGILLVFFSGLITDRIGHRRALAISLLTMGTFTLLLGVVHGRVITPVLVILQSTSIVCFFPAGFSMLSAMFPPHLRNLAVSMVTIVGSFLGAGAIPPAIGYLAEVSSFSSGLILLGVVTLALLPVLRYGKSSPGIDGKADHPNVPVG